MHAYKFSIPKTLTRVEYFQNDIAKWGSVRPVQPPNSRHSNRSLGCEFARARRACANKSAKAGNTQVSPTHSGRHQMCAWHTCMFAYACIYMSYTLIIYSSLACRGSWIDNCAATASALLIHYAILNNIMWMSQRETADAVYVCVFWAANNKTAESKQLHKLELCKCPLSHCN